MPDLPTVRPTQLEPAAEKLPIVDTGSAAAGGSAAADAFRGLDERTCQCLAAKMSSLANGFDAENERVGLALVRRKQCPPGPSAVLSDARYHAAIHARNTTAAEALESYYKLADTEAKADLLARGLTTFDKLRAEAAKLRTAGLPAPAADDLLRRRVQLLLDAEQADSGIRRLNIDLKARLGLDVSGPERLWPTADLNVVPAPIDADAAVQTALETRADLRLLRGLYHGLNAETLDAVREQLSMLRPPVPFARRLDVAAASAAAEIETRRKQLYAMIADRERQIGAEVRAAVIALDSAAKRVALANRRAVETHGKPADKAAETLQAELEWYKARAELMTEITAYHQARVKLRAVQGLLGWECVNAPH